MSEEKASQYFAAPPFGWESGKLSITSQLESEKHIKAKRCLNAEREHREAEPEAGWEILAEHTKRGNGLGSG